MPSKGATTPAATPWEQQVTESWLTAAPPVSDCRRMSPLCHGRWDAGNGPKERGARFCTGGCLCGSRGTGRALTFLQSSHTTQADPRGPSCSPQRMQRFTPSPSTLRRMSSSRVMRRLEERGQGCRERHPLGKDPTAFGPAAPLPGAASGRTATGMQPREKTYPRGHVQVLYSPTALHTASLTAREQIPSSHVHKIHLCTGLVSVKQLFSQMEAFPSNPSNCLWKSWERRSWKGSGRRPG